MGKGRKQRDRHRGPASSTQHSHQSSGDPPAGPVKDSPSTVSPEENFFTSRYSKRKITSNWERYADSEVSGSKADESESAQRLTQLLEQSVLLSSRSSFQPSLDALSDATAHDDYGSVFTIDCDYLATVLADVPVSEKLGIDPAFCQGMEGALCKRNATSADSAIRNSEDAIFMNSKNQPMGVQTVDQIAAGNGAAGTVNMFTTRTLQHGDNSNKTAMDSVLAKSTPLSSSTVDNCDADDLEVLTDLLAVGTTNSGEANAQQQDGNTGYHGDHVESGPPATGSHGDEEMDQMLEELLAL